MKNKFFKLIFRVLAMILFTISASAQPVDPPIDDDPIDPVPIDNWVLMLILIGITLGIYLKFKSLKRTMP